MALSALTVWEVRTTGNDLNGGGFKAGGSGTDYSQQDAAQLSVTDADASGTTNLHSTTGGFTSQMVDNLLQLSGGTLTAGTYHITAFVDTNNVTLDRSPGTGSGTTCKVGGARATLSTILNGTAITDNLVWAKAGTYTRTATETYTSTNVLVRGYSSTRGDDAGRPVFTTATNSVNLITNNGSSITYRHCKFTNTAGTPGKLFVTVTAASGVTMIDCVADGFTYGVNDGFTFTQTNVILLRSTFQNFTTGGFQNGVIADRCKFISVSGTILSDGGISSNSTLVRRCSSYGGTTFLSHSTNNVALTVSENTIINTSGTAISVAAVAAGTSPDVSHNIIWSSGGYGIDNSSGITSRRADRDIFNSYNAIGSATSGAMNNLNAGVGDVTLTANPCVDPANGDFSLNNTAGGGALVRAAGFPSYLDIGAVQHQDSGGGGARFIHSVGGGFSV